MNVRNRVILAVSIGVTVLGFARVFWLKQPVSLAAADVQPPSSTQARPQAVNAKLVAANTKLSFKLFREVLKQQPIENVFISPTSIAIALAIAYNGAAGQTQQSIAQTLELQGMSLQEINQANAALKASLENPDPDVVLSIANSFWISQSESCKPEFIQKIQGFYGAEVKNLDFGQPNAASTINAWVRQNTQTKIDKIVEEKEIGPNTVFLLLNAIYYRGNWTYPFPKEATKEHPFTRSDGTQKQHPMMFQELYGVGYYENEMFQAIELPYGEGRLSMYVFLPHENSSLKTFYESLNAENWQKWMKQLDPEQNPDFSRAIFIGLPRFKVEYSIELEEVLKALGMEIAFTKDADFSAMTPSPLSIDKVKHKTYVEVSEEGTEAAAVTEGGGTRGGNYMIVNRPFFFAITDKQTATILFMGSVVEPR